jgi:hypothetical protein
MFGWLNSERRTRRRTIRSDRKHLEARARHFLKKYLEADEMRKPQFYRAVDHISQKCQPAELGSGQPAMSDHEIAEATSQAALQMVLDRNKRLKEDDRVGQFVTDACATVAVAYHRAAGVYEADENMQKLGTAAVHLLTMATSHMRNESPDDANGV